MTWITQVLPRTEPSTHSVLKSLSESDSPAPEVNLSVREALGIEVDGVFEAAWPEHKVAVIVESCLSEAAYRRLALDGWQLVHAGSDPKTIYQLRAALETTPTMHVDSMGAQGACTIRGEWLYPHDLEGRQQRRWDRLAAEVGHDGALPTSLIYAMRGDEHPASLTDEQLEDLLALGREVALPPVRAPQVAVDSKGNLSAGGPNLQIQTVLSDGTKPVSRNGPLWTNGSDTYVLPYGLHAGLAMLDDGPPDRSSGARHLWWGKVRTHLDAHRVQYDRYLGSINYHTVEQFTVQLNEDQSGLTASIPNVSQDVTEQLIANLRERPTTDRPLEVAIRHADGTRTRAILPMERKVRQQLVTVKKLNQRAQKSKQRNQVWRDIPRLLDAPDTIFDPSIVDIQDYGDRVVGFGTLVYRIAAFQSSSEEESSYVLRGPSGEQAPDWTLAQQAELAESLREASSQGLSYVHFEGQWVAVPPVEVTEAYQKSVAKRAEPAPNQETLIPALNHTEVTYTEDVASHGTVISEIGPPPGLRADISLYPYQMHGLRWLAGHAGLSPQASKHGMLADDMGLGKTLQVLSLLSHRKAQGGGPALVVAPLSLLENWVSEAGKFFPGVFRKIYILRPQTRIPLAAMRQADLVLTSYDSLRRRQLELAKLIWDVMILDESHQIRNPTTKNNAAVINMTATIKIAISGTPVQNSVEDMWAQFDWLAPGYLGSLTEFRDRYAKATHEELEPLREQLHPRILRRLKTEVLAKELPAKHVHTVELPMHDDQAALYDQILVDHRLAAKRGSFGTMHKLFKACAEPSMLTADIDSGPKLQWLSQTLDRIEQKQEKAIIFAEWYELQDLLRDFIFQTRGIWTERLNGQVEASHRLSLVNQFNAAVGFSVMILGPKAAGVGLNVVGANHVIHFTRHWNPALEEQATDRAYRIGQTRDVHVYLPIVCHPERTSIEVHLDQLLQEKRAMAQELLAPHHVLSAKADLQKLVREQTL